MCEDLKKKMLESVLEALVTGNTERLHALADESTELAIRIACENTTKHAAKLRDAATAAPNDTIKERLIHAAETLEQAVAVVLAGGEVTVDGRDNR